MNAAYLKLQATPLLILVVAVDEIDDFPTFAYIYSNFFYLTLLHSLLGLL
jgi:hypothetical protein